MKIMITTSTRFIVGFCVNNMVKQYPKEVSVNLDKTLLKLPETHDEINVVNGQIGSIISTYDLSKSTINMNKINKYAVYYTINEGYRSWYEFICEIFKLTGKNIKVNGFPIKANRPFYSRLGKEKLIKKIFKVLDFGKELLIRYFRVFI